MKIKHSLRLVIFVFIAVLVLGLRAFASQPSVQADYSTSVTTTITSSSTAGTTLAQHSGYGMDCNGYSPVYPNAPWQNLCTEPRGSIGASGSGRYYDNGHYIGHDEPSVQFFSSANESGYNFQWALTLPKDPSLPPTQNGSVIWQNELGIFWLSLSLCDPLSFPFNPCTPDSNSNIGGPYPPASGAAGAANLELQFYPPYDYSDCGSHWCVGMSIESFEAGNSNCGEPANFAWIQMNGVPTGPPGPGEQTTATHFPNNETLLLGQGDQILVTINDTSAGMYNGIQDLTTGQSGYMVASAANGFLHTNVKDCSTSPFSFHPEFATAAPTSVSPWTGQAGYIDLAFEIGHFELGQNGDNDTDEVLCSVYQGVHFCGGGAAGASNADVDFDSLSYNASSWPDGTSNRPTSLLIGNPGDSGVGPASWDGRGYSVPYDQVMFATIVSSSNPACDQNTGAGCVIPPGPAQFYPFYSLSGSGNQCVMTFGTNVSGVTTNDFGGDAQYGSSDPHDHIFVHGAPISNPCMSGLQRLEINYSVPNANSLHGVILSKPSLSYLSSGQVHDMILGSASTIVYADPESVWNLTESQQGLPQGIRIEGVGTSSGNLSLATDVNMTYYLQAQEQFNYTVGGGGSGYSPPSVQYLSLGAPNQTSPGTVWADLGSTYSYPAQLGGSTASERWQANQSEITGNVAGSGSVAPSFYHQYLVSFASQSGLGTISPSQSQWFDAGETYPISASPSSGYSFNGWSSSSTLIAFGNASSPSTTVAINGSGTIQANFEALTTSSSASSHSTTSTSSLGSTTTSTTAKGGGGNPALFVIVGIVVVILVVGILRLRRRLPKRS